MQAMRFARWPAPHLLPCGPVPNRPLTGTGLQSGGWELLPYNTFLMIGTCCKIRRPNGYSLVSAMLSELI